MENRIHYLIDELTLLLEFEELKPDQITLVQDTVLFLNQLNDLCSARYVRREVSNV